MRRCAILPLHRGGVSHEYFCRGTSCIVAYLRSRFFLFIAPLTCTALCWWFGTPAVQAANIWDGGGANDFWGTPQNWDDNLVPAFPQAITFGGTTRLTPNNNLASITVNGIAFDASAGAFVVGGNSLVLGGDIVDNASALERINNPLALSAGRTINVPVGGNLTLGGAISGAGSGITKIGDGALTLFGATPIPARRSLARQRLTEAHCLWVRGAHWATALAPEDWRFQWLDACSWHWLAGPYWFPVYWQFGFDRQLGRGGEHGRVQRYFGTQCDYRRDR